VDGWVADRVEAQKVIVGLAGLGLAKLPHASVAEEGVARDEGELVVAKLGGDRRSEDKRIAHKRTHLEPKARRLTEREQRGAYESGAQVAVRVSTVTMMQLWVDASERVVPGI
jgi:hypothetical protein